MIELAITLPNGVTAALHGVGRIEMVAPHTQVTLNILSYPNETAYLAGNNPVWNTPLALSAETFSLSAIEAWLIANAASPLAGGLIVPDNSASLGTLKSRKWQEIKQARTQAEYAGFTWGGSVFDSDAISQSRISGAVQLASLAGATFTIDWTLADNSVRTLSAADMDAVAMALGQHVQTQFIKAQGLRTQIDAALNPAQVAAVVW